MTGYKRVNYYELCRLCTSSQPKDKIHIFREEGRKMQLQQKIQCCFPLLVCEHDYLPKVVCTSCIETLDQCYMFRQNCINSETMLSSYFSNFRFTDDFKKAGKVYVKDTGQKLENVNQNIKKTVQDNISHNILQDNQHQQYFTLELPAVQNKNIQNYTKLSVPNNMLQNNDKALNDDYINLNSNQSILTTQKLQTEQLKYNLKTNDTQTNILSCNITELNINSNSISNKSNYEPKISNDIDQNSDFNLDKTNLQPMMLIDVDQLIESGLPENEVDKLKEVLAKQDTCNSSKDLNNDSNITINNTNNNNSQINKNEFVNRTKSFKCDICEKLFKRREHLYQHSKLHSGLRPFNCIHCSKTFSRKEHLIRHLTSHSGKKDYPCEICNKKFSRPDNLKKHKKTHQKTGPFICEICQKTFVIKHYYLVHKLNHEGDSVPNNMSKIEVDLS